MDDEQIRMRVEKRNIVVQDRLLLEIVKQRMYDIMQTHHLSSMTVQISLHIHIIQVMLLVIVVSILVVQIIVHIFQPVLQDEIVKNILVMNELIVLQ